MEIYEIESVTKLRGLFGPNPTVWTFFMFLHFIVILLFITALIWMYTNIALKDSLIYPITTMVGLFVLWFVLYFAGRIGREAGKKEMHALHRFMEQTLETVS